MHIYEVAHSSQVSFDLLTKLMTTLGKLIKNVELGKLRGDQ